MPKKFSSLNFTILAFFIGLILLVTLAFSNGMSLASREAVKDFSYVDVNGKSGNLYQFADKPVILHFWASWCIPCREELPKLIAKAGKTPDTTYILISIDQSKAAMLGFLEPEKAHLSSNIILIHDPEAAITRDVFKVDGFPETIILNKDKTIARHAYGMIDWGDR